MSGEAPGPRVRQDNFREPPPIRPDRDFGADLVMALRFFSRLPTGDRPFEPPDLTRIAVALPFASVIIALGPALLLMLSFVLPAYFAAALAVAAMLTVTGAMADDALADAADGLVGGATPERRLEIMKDSRHGTYGVAALCLYIVLRVVALGSLAAAHGPAAAAAVLVAATVLARSSSLWLSLELPNARAGGASASAGRVGRNSFGIGLLFSAIIAFIVAAPFTSLVAVVLAFLVAGLIAWGWTAVCRKLVGGQTGDLIGALQALIEVGVLTVLLAFA